MISTESKQVLIKRASLYFISQSACTSEVINEIMKRKVAICLALWQAAVGLTLGQGPVTTDKCE